MSLAHNMRDFTSEPSDEDMLNFTLRQRHPPIFRISDMARKKREKTEEVTGNKTEYSRWMVEDNKRRKASLAQWMAGTGGGDFDRIYGGAGGVGRGKGSFDANQAAYLDAYGQMGYDVLPDVHSEELRPMVRHGWKPPKSMEHMTDYLVDGPFDDGWNKKQQNFPKSKVAIRDLPQGVKNMMNNLRDVNFGFAHQSMLDNAEDEYGRVGTRNAQQEYRKPGGARDQFTRRMSMEAADLLNMLDNSRNRDNQEVLDNFKESDLEWNSADRPRGEHVSQSPSRRTLEWPHSLRTLHETDEDAPVIMNEAFPENFQLFNRSEDEVFETAWDLMKAPYHGTTTDVLPQIMREGIQPQRANQFLPPLVFYSDDPDSAISYSKIRSDSGGDPVLLHFPSEAIKNPSMNHGMGYMASENAISPEDLKVIHGPEKPKMRTAKKISLDRPRWNEWSDKVDEWRKEMIRQHEAGELS